VIAAALDMMVLASKNKACVPIAVLEAVAGGVPDVVTDPGGVGPRHAYFALGSCGRSRHGDGARWAASRGFSMPIMMAPLESLYEGLQPSRQGRGRDVVSDSTPALLAPSGRSSA